LYTDIRDNRYLYNGYGGPAGYLGNGTLGAYGGWNNQYVDPYGYNGYEASWFGRYSSGGYGGYPGYGGYGWWWIWALLILIVIVLQFSRNFNRSNANNDLLAGANCCNTNNVLGLTNNNNKSQDIDNSVLFIIIIFLLILCSCWWGHGSYGGYGGYW